MFNWLGKIDLPGRLDSVAPRLLTRVVVTLALLVIVGVARRAIEAAVPGVVPFALQFPAVLLATLMAGWVSGVAVLTIGGLYAWFVAFHPPAGVEGPTAAEVVSLLLYAISAGSVVVFAELFRARARVLVGGQAALRESEARLELATGAAAVGVWEWRLDTNEMIYSPEAKAICGFAPDARVTFEMVAAITHPDDFPQTSAQARRTRSSLSHSMYRT